MSERLTLAELTHWCAKNTQPLYPMGLIVVPLGLLVKLHQSLCFTKNVAWLFQRLEHFTWQSIFSCHNLICSVIKEHLTRNIIPCKQVFCYAKRRFTSHLLIGLRPTHSLRMGVLSPNYDRKMIFFSSLNAFQMFIQKNTIFL